jgi:hypothetical protein
MGLHITFEGLPRRTAKWHFSLAGRRLLDVVVSVLIWEIQMAKMTVAKRFLRGPP